MFHAGQKIGLYTLIEKIGKGSFGEVWMAEKRTQFVTKRVAIKLPHDEVLDFDAIRQEATLWEEASGHPNVLPIIDADIYDGQVAIVSEYAGDGSIADKLKIEKKFPIREAVELTIGILNGLEYLHNKKIIHRDIKPANVLLQGNMPRLADFGISRAVETSTISSVVVGTESYMSPEAFDGKRNVQTDIWSVGVLLYQLLTGRLPFPQKRATEVMYAILLKEPEPLPDEIPQRLQEIVLKALEKDKELADGEEPKRYQSAAAMRDDLKSFLETLSQPAAAAAAAGEADAAPAFAEVTAPVVPDITAPVSPPPTPPTPSEEVTRVKLRIPLDDLKTWYGFQKTLVRKDVLPFVILLTVLGFFGIGWLTFKLFNNTPPPPAANSDISNSVDATPLADSTPPPPANTLSNFDNNAVSNSNAANSNDASNRLTVLEYFNQATKFYKQKKYDRAIEAYTKAIELNPSDYTLYNNRGLIHYTKRDYERAINDFDKSLELHQTSLTYNNRGVAYEDKGDIEQAIADYRKAIELDPTNEQANRNLNKILK